MTRQPRNLRPQSVGGLLDSTFRFYRRYFLRLLILTACIYLPYLILESIFNIHTSALFSNLMQNAQQPAQVQQDVLNHLPSLIGTIVFAIISALIVVPLLYGSILHIVVGLQTETEVPSNMSAFRHASRRLPAVIGTNIIRWLLLVVGSLLAGGVIAGVGMLFTTIRLTSAAVAVAVTLLTMTAAVILIWLGVKLAFSSAVALEERLSGFTAIRRSFAMTQGSVWRVIGYYIVIQLIMFVASIGFVAVFSLIPSQLIGSILTDVVDVLITPFSLVAMSHLYVDLWIRTDAPDLAAWLQGE